MCSTQSKSKLTLIIMNLLRTIKQRSQNQHSKSKSYYQHVSVNMTTVYLSIFAAANEQLMKILTELPSQIFAWNQNLQVGGPVPST